MWMQPFTLILELEPRRPFFGIAGVILLLHNVYLWIGLDAATMEATAMRDGLSLANTFGFHNIEAESDSTQVIDFCTGQSHWWDAAAAIFAECVDLTTSIGKVKFKHCPRIANSVAHELDSYSFCNNNSIRWINEPLGWLIGTLVKDVMGVNG